MKWHGCIVMIGAVLLSTGCMEENLGEFLKGHYSDFSISAEASHNWDALSVTELSDRLQNKWVTNIFHIDRKDVKRLWFPVTARILSFLFQTIERSFNAPTLFDTMWASYCSLHTVHKLNCQSASSLTWSIRAVWQSRVKVQIKRLADCYLIPNIYIFPVETGS